MAEQLDDFVNRGFTGLNLIVTGADKPRQMKRLAKEVIPAVRRRTHVATERSRSIECGS